MHYLKVEDPTLQLIHKFLSTVTGVPNTVDGIMDIIQQAKQRHQKRAYLCIKLLVNIFHT